MFFFKQHPYITATLVATLLAIVVWLCTPKEYTAITKVSDEYKEMDLAIGMNKLKADLRNILNSGNQGLNDMEVYCKLLKTEDFARSISKKTVPGKDMTYGEYLGERDTINEIQKRINYNFDSKLEALIIGFTDRDATLAAMMLDSVTTNLQAIITKYRQDIALVLLENAKQNQYDNLKRYKKAQSDYVLYFDTHNNLQSKSEEQHLKALEKEVQLAYKEWKISSTECARQEALARRVSPSFATIQSITTPTKCDRSVIEYILCFVFVTLLLTKGVILYRRKKLSNKLKFDFGGLTSPWTMTITVWGGLLFLLLFRDPVLLNAPKEQFYVSLALWLFFLCVTSFFTFNLLDRNETANHETPEFTRLNLYAYHFLLFLSIVMTPLYVKKIYDVVLMFGTEDFMYNVRILANTGDLNIGILTFSVPINISLMLVSLWRYPQIKLWQLVWACTACILNSLAIMEKGEILTVFFCIIFVLYERKRIRIRSIAIIFILVILFFFAFNLLRSGDDSEYQQEETIWGFIAMYLLSPPVAFGELSQDVIHQFAARTVPTLYYLIDKYAGENYIIYDRLQPFVYVPVITNVYTTMQPFYQDFGYIGVAFGGIIYGLFGGVLYRRMRNGCFYSKCLYLYFAYILTMQFFQENLFTLGLFIPELMLLTYLCTQKTFTLSQKST